MAKPLDDDFNYDVKSAPREARGGVLAPADIPLIKRCITSHIATLGDSNEDESDRRQIVNLLHRLNRMV